MAEGKGGIICPDCGKEFKNKAGLAGHLKIVYGSDTEGGEVTIPESEAREAPIVEVDFTTAELVGGKRIDIIRKASYGTCDKAASR